ncbi:hypothetical protein LTR27_008393 [Elasticomyces elasticus]|nr:hypothetical protein LTR27_008393 [Elasticomyces elasticus]
MPSAVFSQSNVEQEGETSPSMKMPPRPEDTADVQPSPKDGTEQTTHAMPYRKYTTDMYTSFTVRIHILNLGRLSYVPKLLHDLIPVTPATTYVEFKDMVEARNERSLDRLIWGYDDGHNQYTWDVAKSKILAGCGTELYLGTSSSGPWTAKANSPTHHSIFGMLLVPPGHSLYGTITIY